MFIQRFVLTLVLGPLALLLIYLGGWFYFLPIAVVLLFAVVEFAQMMEQLEWSVPLWLLVPAAAVQWVIAQWGWTAVVDLTIALTLFLMMVYALWQYEQRQPRVLARWWALNSGFLLLGWVGAHFFRLRSLPEFGMEWAMLAMLATWFADSFAYLVGRYLAGRLIFGRHRMSPQLSPNKTIEGYLGGAVLSILFTMLVASWLNFPLLHAFLLATAVSLLSPLGDLGISLLKREAVVKDSGTLFRGHGGALDRIDSLMWAVTLAFYLATFFPIP
jgi:phosphatidate cytidylyltransferase